MKRQRKRRSQPANKPLAKVLAGVVKLLESQVDVLEMAMQIFQQAQRMLPLPSATELAEMKKGSRPVGRTVYLLGFLQRAGASLEEVATALRNEIEDATEDVQREGLSQIDFNAIKEAIHDLTTRDREEKT